jgi:acetyl-CoA carboxylase biotin carboxyl carrier protein
MKERELIIREHAERQWLLACPAPGRLTMLAESNDWVVPRRAIATLEVLGVSYRLTIPAGVSGSLRELAGSFAARAVGYGDVIARIDQQEYVADAAEPDQPHAVTGLMFRAPTSGRFYGRPTPDKPPFVSAGSELGPGTTICLLEVMKTFNRVTYGGAELPERARVREVLVVEGADVNAGDPLLALST